MPKVYVTMPSKKPISPRSWPVKTAIHLQSTKINKNRFVTRAFRPGLKESFCTLYFWNTQQKRGKISARQFSTRIYKLACEVWSCFGHAMFDFSKKSRACSCPRPFNYNNLPGPFTILIVTG